MEGHGAWRSRPTETTCNPGVHYAKDDLICICTKSGNWPHRKCKSIFNKLHKIEPNPLQSFEDTCTPGKTYLVKCNICHCGRDGHVYEEYCLPMDCKEKMPAILHSESTLANTRDRYKYGKEVYAECAEDVTYKLNGCRTCICQQNNRLICDKCEIETIYRAKGDNIKGDDNNKSTVCGSMLPGVVFYDNCNQCFCSKEGELICTMRLCIGSESSTDLRLLSELGRTKSDSDVLVEAPVDDKDCVPGTSFKKECNYCSCLQGLGEVKKIVVCTKMACSPPSRSNPEASELIAYIKNDCVPGMLYEKDCRSCYCIENDGVKREACTAESVCEREAVKDKIPGDLASLHGYCEPLHVYKKGCNTCECLADGKIIRCTSENCVEKSKSNAIEVEILPVYMPNDGVTCSKFPSSYKVGCNYCYCLPNGNALCTTAHCVKKKRYN